MRKMRNKRRRNNEITEWMRSLRGYEKRVTPGTNEWQELRKEQYYKLKMKTVAIQSSGNVGFASYRGDFLTGFALSPSPQSLN
jgi:hypothetical protein